MKNVLIYFLIGVFASVATPFAQNVAPANSISILGEIISETQLFQNPLSANADDRNSVLSLGTAFGYGLAVEREITGGFFAGISFRSFTHNAERADNAGTVFKNGYTISCLESGGAFALPLGGERFRLSLGGGLGIYWGRRLYSVAGLSAMPLSAPATVRLLVFLKAEYFFTRSFGLVAGMHFRDPYILAWNRFQQDKVYSNGAVYTLNTESFASRISFNANCYTAGLVVRF